MTRQALEGVKVADFSWYLAGPMIGSILACHGAEVVRVESTIHVDGHRTTPPYKDNKPGINRSGCFASQNLGKYGVTLNLRHPKGLEVAKKLIARADIMVENFIPGTIEKFGLGYEEVKKVKPDIIMLSSCNQGHTGPHARHPGFGSHLINLVGFSSTTGWPDRGPVFTSVPITDITGWRMSLVVLLAALDYRRRTGKGQYIDISQYEAALQFLSPILMDFTANGRVAGRAGNRNPAAAPHGVFPCLGEDRWCAIAVFNDTEWQAMCRAMGQPELAHDPRFDTLAHRKQNEDELERLVAGWTSQLQAEEVMGRVQGVGVAAGVVNNAKGLPADTQLRHRNYYRELNHPEIGNISFDSSAFILSRTPSNISRPGPCMGEHNHYVYTQLLGIPDQEFVELMDEGVFA